MSRRTESSGAEYFLVASFLSLAIISTCSTGRGGWRKRRKARFHGGLWMLPCYLSLPGQTAAPAPPCALLWSRSAPRANCWTGGGTAKGMGHAWGTPTSAGSHPPRRGTTCGGRGRSAGRVSLFRAKLNLKILFPQKFFSGTTELVVKNNGFFIICVI